MCRSLGFADFARCPSRLELLLSLTGTVNLSLDGLDVPLSNLNLLLKTLLVLGRQVFEKLPKPGLVVFCALVPYVFAYPCPSKKLIPRKDGAEMALGERAYLGPRERDGESRLLRVIENRTFLRIHTGCFALGNPGVIREVLLGVVLGVFGDAGATCHDDCFPALTLGPA